MYNSKVNVRHMYEAQYYAHTNEYLRLKIVSDRRTSRQIPFHTIKRYWMA